MNRTRSVVIRGLHQPNLVISFNTKDLARDSVYLFILSGGTNGLRIKSEGAGARGVV